MNSGYSTTLYETLYIKESKDAWEIWNWLNEYAMMSGDRADNRENWDIYCRNSSIPSMMLILADLGLADE